MALNTAAAFTQLLKVELETIEPNITCPLCNGWFKRCVKGTCGHKFCEECIIPHLHKCCQCPTCNFPLWRCELNSAVAFQSLVDAIQHLWEISNKWSRHDTSKSSSTTEIDDVAANEIHEVYALLSKNENTVKGNEKWDSNANPTEISSFIDKDATHSCFINDPELVDSDMQGLSCAIRLDTKGHSTITSDNFSTSHTDEDLPRSKEHTSLLAETEECQQTEHKLRNSLEEELRATQSLLHIVERFLSSKLDETVLELLKATNEVQKSEFQNSREIIDAFESSSLTTEQPLPMKQKDKPYTVMEILPLNESKAYSAVKAPMHNDLDDSLSSTKMRINSNSPLSSNATLQMASPFSVLNTFGDSRSLNTIPNAYHKETGTAESFDTPPLPIILATALTPNHLKEALIGANVLGGKVHRDFHSSISHLIVEVDAGNRAISRTVKYMKGILLGKWIVNINWVSESVKAKTWLPEHTFEISGDAFALKGAYYSRINNSKSLEFQRWHSKLHAFEVAYGLPISTEDIAWNRLKDYLGTNSPSNLLFAGICFCLDASPISTFVPPLSDLQSILYKGGGYICTHKCLNKRNDSLMDGNHRGPPESSENSVQSIYSVVVLLDSAITTYETAQAIRANYDVSVAPIKWVFDCISSYKQLELPSLSVSFQRAS